jgi:16S rRNA (guanine527-N7)-methyltransferase
MLPVYDDANKLFSEMQLDVSHETYQNMEDYAAFLVEYNEKVNLTAITDGDGILKKHFIDSMLLNRFCAEELRADAKLLDIGSGAGFPGVPLALLRGDLDITLMDSLNKRITFLELLRERLGLRYQAVHGRAEEMAKKPDFRESFDVVTARAVAALPTLAEYSLPFVKVGGYWLAMKGPGEELKPALQAIRVLGGSFVRTESYHLPDGEERVIYVVKKISQTATKYPRNSGQIKSKPL